MIESLEKIVENLNHDSKIELFYTILESIKLKSNFLDIYNDSFIEYLISILKQTQNNSKKTILIEILVQFFYDYDCKIELLEQILNEYIICLDNHLTSIDDAIICLKGFIDCGIDKEKLFISLARKLDKSFLISIFSEIDILELSQISQEFKNLFEEIQFAYIIKWRSRIIGEFLLLVNDNCRTFSQISAITLVHKSYIDIYEDCWPKGILNLKAKIIKFRILSFHEFQILEKLDVLLSKNIELNSIEIKKLYEDFFKGRDIFDVIYTLED